MLHGMIEPMPAKHLVPGLIFDLEAQVKVCSGNPLNCPGISL
jgi:hypothetical protein